MKWPLFAILLHLVEGFVNKTFKKHEILRPRQQVQTLAESGTTLTFPSLNKVLSNLFLSTKKEILNLQKLPFNIYVNCKSGGKLGEKIMSSLHQITFQDYICNMNYESPKNKLMSSVDNALMNNSSFDIPGALCIGGDGTIRWVMDEARQLNISQSIAFGVIPSGTGNDFFNHIVQSHSEMAVDTSSNHIISDGKRLRTLISPNNLIYNTLPTLHHFFPPYQLVEFDRWGLEIFKRGQASLSNDSSSSASSTSTILTRRMKLKRLLRAVKTNILKKVIPSRGISKRINFNNYFGIGIDGDITTTYDNMRRQAPALFFHQIINKFWFAVIWIYKFFFGNQKNLSELVEIICDGQSVDISRMNLKGLIFTNICSYAGGTKLWTFEDLPWRKQESNDGVIELVGLTSMTHLAQIKGGLAKPIPIAQGKHFRILNKSRMPMQVDGEPLLQSSSIIDLHMLERVKLIVPKLSGFK